MIILILLSGFDPCREETDCPDVLKTQVDETSHKQAEKLEICSPLCLCANCFFSVLIPCKPHLPLTFYKALQRSGKHLSSKPIHLNYSIWQPPKVIC
jgi:hypothetical protein